jgi:hypothetical protein
MALEAVSVWVANPTLAASLGHRPRRRAFLISHVSAGPRAIQSVRGTLRDALEICQAIFRIYVFRSDDCLSIDHTGCLSGVELDRVPRRRPLLSPPLWELAGVRHSGAPELERLWR